MKKINEFVDKLEKRIEGIFKGITHGQNIDQEKVKESIKKEVIALCKDYYMKGFDQALNAYSDGYNEEEINEDLKIYLKHFKEK